MLFSAFVRFCDGTKLSVANPLLSLSSPAPPTSIAWRGRLTLEPKIRPDHIPNIPRGELGATSAAAPAGDIGLGLWPVMTLLLPEALSWNC